ncbi:hypothetical protein BBJ28_00004679 [Nothophytophthora sp. Chile5]|nr:hypothetical protein BBJ28_00004679 [Nothophytophthora sp. Chile5]
MAEPPAKKRPKRVVPFLEAHELLYGVRVTERDADSGAARSVLCMFCAAFGREDDPRPAGRQRARTQKPKYWGGPCFRTDNYKSHLKAQHPARWTEYQALTREARRGYFDAGIATAAPPPPPTSRGNGSTPSLVVAPPTAAPTPPVNGASQLHVAGSVAPPLPPHSYAPVAAVLTSPQSSIPSNEDEQMALTFLLDRDVVDIALGDVLFRPDDMRSHGGNARAQTLAPFASTLDQRDAEDQQRSDGTAEYRVVVRPKHRFYRAIRLLATGLSFQQTAAICQSLPNDQRSDGAFGSEDVARMSRAAVGVNLQALARLLHRSWAFALALHTVDRRRPGDREPRLFLDVRLNVCWAGKLEQFHLLALPMADGGEPTACGELLFDTTAKFLQTLHKRWLRKVIGCSTEVGGAAVANVSSTASAVALAFARRLEQQALSGLVRVSSARPPLDALLQRFFDSLLTADGSTWHVQLTGLAAYLQRQQSVGNAEELVTSAAPPCPPVSNMSWQNTVDVARWFDDARAPIQRLLTRTNAQVTPSPAWWLTLKLALVVGALAAKTRAALHGGHTTLLSQQPERISMLRLALAADVGIDGPLPQYQRAALRDQTGLGDLLGSSDGAFAVKTQSVVLFVRGLGGWVAEIFDALDAQTRQTVVASAAHRMLELVQGLHGVVAELEALGSSGSASLRTFPPVLPHQLAGLHPVDFQEIVRGHRARLAESFSDSQLAAIEAQHRELRAAAASEAAVRQLLELGAESPDAGFERSWAVLGRRWGILADFCGGLATVFPPSESDEVGDSAAAFSALVAASPPPPPLVAGTRSKLADFPLEAGLQSQQFTRLQALDVLR